jgi:drug/metabolite transporter (DMT)-like permease
LDARAILLGLAFAFIWSSAFTSAKIALADAPPFLMLAVRFLVSGLVGVGLAAALGQSLVLTRAQWRLVVVFGFCQNSLYLGLNFLAMTRIEAGFAAIIASLLPLIVAAASRAFLGERLGAVGLAGLLAGFGGVLIIMLARLGGGADLLGVALCLVGAAALAVATLVMRGISAGDNVLMIVGLQMLVGGVTLAPVGLAFESFGDVNWTWSLFFAFTYTTLAPGLLATVVWFRLVRLIGATRAATFHFLNPFFGVAVAGALLGETFSGRDMTGVAIIMGGILAVQLSRQSVRRPTTAQE